MITIDPKRVQWRLEDQVVLACRTHRVVALVVNVSASSHCERCIEGKLTCAVSRMVELPEQDALLATYATGGWSAMEAAALEVLDRDR